MTLAPNIPAKWLVAAIFIIIGLHSPLAMAQAADDYMVDAWSPAAGKIGGHPLKPGELTMHDILKSSQDADNESAGAANPPPVTVVPLDKNVAIKKELTQPKKLRQAAPPLPESRPPASAQLPNAAPGAVLQQGMSNVLELPSQRPPRAAAIPSATQTLVAPSVDASETSADASSTSSGCVPKVSRWTKTCVEAGYPESFVGQVTGETRSTCPEGALKDVWISNGCVPPNDKGLVRPKPLTAPSTEAEYSTTEVRTAPSNTAKPPAAMTSPKALPLSSGEAAREDAKCGLAQGAVTEKAPSGYLCANGVPGDVNGNGPWTWTCSGKNGGRTTSCAAPKRSNGVCGSASGTGSDHTPDSNLCDTGYATSVTGSGPWSWNCSGLNGGTSTACSATLRLKGEEGACGSANGKTLPEEPADNLCASGKPSVVSGFGPWAWSCSGGEGTAAANCSAERTAEPVNISNVKDTKPEEPAAAASTVEKPAGGEEMKPQEKSSLCGSAADFVAIEKPTENLCKSGTAGDVSGDSPWNWTCSEKGHISSCSTITIEGANADPTPLKAEVTPVIEKAESKPIVLAAADASEAVKSSKAKDHAAVPPHAPPAPAAPKGAMCGKASEEGASSAPKRNLCAEGKATAVKGKGPWTWSCKKGKRTMACTADKTANGACGAANGTMQKVTPTQNLCSVGHASAVEGKGPWMWTCQGIGGGGNMTCSATSQAQMQTDGSCGMAATVAATAIPDTNLCNSGHASAVKGEGPWTWTCSGINGGAAASCSTLKDVISAPPPPGPVVNGLCGAANGAAVDSEPAKDLCVTGTATAISGNGPWNWNCIGANNGMSVSCTAPMVPPAPITGVCGSANGVATLSAPQSGLCSGGISSAVSGKGPWTWSCSGVNGGGAVGCVAPIGGGKTSSLPSLTTPYTASSTLAAPQNTQGLSRKGLVTPKLSMVPLPPAPKPTNLGVPDETPTLPADTKGLPPPPLRDMGMPVPPVKQEAPARHASTGNINLDDDLASIPFAEGVENLDEDAEGNLSKLADILNQNPDVRLTLTAYAEGAGATPRESRHISLNRALIIRDYLASKGIDNSRIDVRALGANLPDSGNPNRVDIKPN